MTEWREITPTSPPEYGLYEVMDETHPEIVVEARLRATGWEHRYKRELGGKIPEYIDITHWREYEDVGV